MSSFKLSDNLSMKLSFFVFRFFVLNLTSTLSLWLLLVLMSIPRGKERPSSTDYYGKFKNAALFPRLISPTVHTNPSRN